MFRINTQSRKGTYSSAFLKIRPLFQCKKKELSNLTSNTFWLVGLVGFGNRGIFFLILQQYSYSQPEHPTLYVAWKLSSWLRTSMFFDTSWGCQWPKPSISLSINSQLKVYPKKELFWKEGREIRLILVANNFQEKPTAKLILPVFFSVVGKAREKKIIRFPLSSSVAALYPAMSHGYFMSFISFRSCALNTEEWSEYTSQKLY